MRRFMRAAFDRSFTGSAVLSVVLMVTALVIILGPMLYRGSSAVVFRGTVEFRKLQFYEPLFNRGDRDELQRDETRALAAREKVYAVLDEFARGLDPQSLRKEVRRLHRDAKEQLRNRYYNSALSEERLEQLSDESKKLRNALQHAYEAAEREEALEHLRIVLDYPGKDDFSGTFGERYFRLAREYARVVSSIDLDRRDEYGGELAELKGLVRELFGPRPGERREEPLMQNRYGMTRWSLALRK